MSHSNIALFIPHRGCPHRCSFCDQRAITGQASLPTAADVTHAVETALASGRCDPAATEIAFFGGSFTAVDKGYQEELLAAAYPYVQDGRVQGVRISTRPDCIDSKILDFLQSYGVTAIELGAQSMVDAVLAANGRGHTAADVERASALIRARGISLGLQMMTGLYESTLADDRYTAERLADCRPDTVRIYPTLVMAGTALADLYQSGQYRPMALEDAVDLCADLLELFQRQHIRVIRLGLHDSPAVQNRLAGPYHPAFAELCHSRRFFRSLTGFLAEAHILPGKLAVGVHPRFLSKAIGQGKANQKALAAMGYDCCFFGDPGCGETGEFTVEKR